MGIASFCQAMERINEGPVRSSKTGTNSAIAHVKLPSRISMSPEFNEANIDGARNAPLSARRPQTARSRAHRPSSARTGAHMRRYSHPATGVMPGYNSPMYYNQMGQSLRAGHPYSGGDGGEYAAGGITGPWPAGMAPVPMFNPWGYDMGWGHHPGAPAGMYGMCVMGPALSRRSEKPTRIVFVGQLPAGLEEGTIQDLAAKYGPIRGLDSSQRETSSGVFVSYFDVRHAQAAVKGLPDAVLSGDEDEPPVKPAVHFMLPPTGVAGMENQGILAVTGVAEDVDPAELKVAFSKFGEVKGVLKSGGSGGAYRAVEFYDTRDAARAMAECKNRKPPLAGMQLDYAPFAGLENSVQQPYPVYPMPPAFVPANPLKREDSGPSGGLDAPTSGPSGPVWSMGTMGMQLPAPCGWAPYPMPGPHGSFGSEVAPPIGASAGMPTSAPPVEAPLSMAEAGTGPYMMPQNCRADYYAAPQYMGYPHGMPAMLPFGPGGQPIAMMPPPGRFDGPMSGMRGEVPNSPVHASNGPEAHPWRPNRTGRGGGDRTYDPAQFEFNINEAHTKSANARTTLMIRNIPNKYSQKMLLDVLDRQYSGRYDFFYLPIDFKNRCNLGYAFVNFKNAATTAQFYKEFHSKSWEEFNSKKVCEITYARVQGRNALIEHFRNSRFPCNEPDYLPLVFEPVDEEPQGKRANPRAMKATPVHHWTNLHYPNNSVVAAH